MTLMSRDAVVVPPGSVKVVFCLVVIIGDSWLTGRIMGESRIVGGPVFVEDQSCSCSDLKNR